MTWINDSPQMIKVFLRKTPEMIAYDICSVQPLSGDVALIFTMNVEYDSFIPTNWVNNDHLYYLWEDPIV